MSKVLNKKKERVFCGLVPVDNVDKSVYNPENQGLAMWNYFHNNLHIYLWIMCKNGLKAKVFDL